VLLLLLLLLFLECLQAIAPGRILPLIMTSHITSVQIAVLLQSASALVLCRIR
jgi:hypothetical protein